MRPEVFEALAPVCPRCLHAEGIEAPLTVATTAETRAGRLWHAILHCSNSACWMEFPIIDGVPVIVADPLAYLRNASAHVLARDDLPAALAGLLGDALGPGAEFDTTRQHLSIYAEAHFSDWIADCATAGEPEIVRVLDAGLAALPGIAGPAIDLGGAVGRGAWHLAGAVAPVLAVDLNFSFLRLAQRLALEGEAWFGRRRVGLVYDPVRIALPAEMAGRAPDFWAADAMALPFRAGTFGLATALNLVDSIAGPTEAVAEAARVLAPGGGALFATPHDWSANAAEPARWMGGHSQRGPAEGAAEPVLTATLARAGLEPVAERHDLPWHLRLHARAEMRYALHLVACRKAGG